MEDQQEERRYELSERVTRLETELHEFKLDFKDHVTTEKEWQKTITIGVAEIKALLSRYQGAMGMLMVVITCVWAAFGVFKEWIFQHLK